MIPTHPLSNDSQVADLKTGMSLNLSKMLLIAVSWTERISASLLESFNWGQTVVFKTLQASKSTLSPSLIRIISSSFWIKITVTFGIAGENRFNDLCSMILQELNLSAIVFQILPLVNWFPYSLLSVSLISYLGVDNNKALSASDSNFLRSFSWLFLVFSTLLTIEIMSISTFWVVKLNCFAVERGSTKKAASK